MTVLCVCQCVHMYMIYTPIHMFVTFIKNPLPEKPKVKFWYKWYIIKFYMIV